MDGWWAALLSDLEALKNLVRFWFWKRKGNYMEAPIEEAPEFDGARDAMFFRRRKALADVKEITDRMRARIESIDLLDDDFLIAPEFVNLHRHTLRAGTQEKNPVLALCLRCLRRFAE